MKFNYGKIFLLGFGFFGVSVVWGVYNAFVPIFLANKFHIAPALIGFFMTLDNIAALFIQPPVGAWSDRLRTPLGRRIPFIIVGAPITAVAFGFIPVAAALPVFEACTSTLWLSAALWCTPVVALMPDITPSEKRSQANGIINFMGGIGTIIALQTGGMLYKLSPSFPFWLGSILVLLAALIVFLFIKEPREYEESDEQQPVLPRSDIRAGDVVLGIASSGVHFNGFSLVRRVVAKSELKWSAPAPFDRTKKLGAAISNLDVMAA